MSWSSPQKAPESRPAPIPSSIRKFAASLAQGNDGDEEDTRRQLCAFEIDITPDMPQAATLSSARVLVGKNPSWASGNQDEATGLLQSFVAEVQGHRKDAALATAFMVAQQQERASQQYNRNNEKKRERARRRVEGGTKGGASNLVL